MSFTFNRGERLKIRFPFESVRLEGFPGERLRAQGAFPRFLVCPDFNFTFTTVFGTGKDLRAVSPGGILSRAVCFHGFCHIRPLSLFAHLIPSLIFTDSGKGPLVSTEKRMEGPSGAGPPARKTALMVCQRLKLLIL
jgi:hypothetical protein